MLSQGASLSSAVLRLCHSPGLGDRGEDLALFTARVVAGCSAAQFIVIIGVIAVAGNRTVTSLSLGSLIDLATTAVPVLLGVLWLVTHLIGTS
jgi:hypothetical protein